MRITIIGGGFSGLSTAWFLTQNIPSAAITLYDPIPIGHGTSGLAAGLLHPFAGLHAKLNRLGREGYNATKKLLQLVSSFQNKPVFKETGVLRPAITATQQADYKLCAENYPQVEWIENTQSILPQIKAFPAIYIREGLTIDCQNYLKGLYKMCVNQGVKFEQKNINSLAETSADTIIVAAGASSNQFPELTGLPLSYTKGQLLQILWPENIPPLSIPVNSTAYLLMEDIKICTLGTTFERGFSSPLPDMEKAAKEILPKAALFFPEIAQAKIINCKAGIRVSTPNHMPLVGHWKNNVWVITGMGSKGLLYHALMAEQLATKISHSFS